jgi:hypothetical protein
VFDGSIFPVSLPHLLLVVLLITAIVTGVRWKLTVVLICISFMARDGEHFFHVFFSHLISSFAKILFCAVAHFFTKSLIWGEFSF